MIELNSYMGITCPLFSCQITVITKSDGGGSDLIPLCFVSSVIAEETNGKALQEPAGPCDHRFHRHFAGPPSWAKCNNNHPASGAGGHLSKPESQPEADPGHHKVQP